MLVRVRHPVPVRVIPARARHERVALVDCVTDAEIPELAHSAFEAVDAHFGATEFRLRDGSLWGSLIGSASLSGRRTAAAAFRAWLAGEPTDPQPERLLPLLLRRSPFSAIDPASPPRLDPPGHVRFGAVLGEVRDIRDDLRPRASQAVRDFLRDDCAIVGGRVLTRLCPMARVEALEGTQRLQVELRPHARDSHAILYGLDRLDEARAYHRLDDARTSVDLDRLLGAVYPRTLRPTDRSWYLNAHAGRVREAVSAARRRVPDEGRLARFERELAPIADLALIGIAAPVAHPEAVRLVRDAAEHVVAFLPRGYPGQGLLRNLVDVHDRVLAPAHEPEPEDAAALGALAR